MTDEGWVNALRKTRGKGRRRSISSMAQAAGCSDATVKRESLEIAAAALDYEDFRRFVLSVPWVLKE